MPALGKAVALMLLSWGALPIVYYLLVRHKRMSSIEGTGANEKESPILEDLVEVEGGEK